MATSRSEGLDAAQSMRRPLRATRAARRRCCPARTSVCGRRTSVGGSSSSGAPPKKKPPQLRWLVSLSIGAPGRIRTSDPQVRSLVLYPAELRARNRVAQYAERAFGCQAFLSEKQLAETEGFEPSIELLTLYSLSRGAPSASRARSRVCCLISAAATSPPNRTQILAKNAQKTKPGLHRVVDHASVPDSGMPSAAASGSPPWIRW